MAGIMNFEDVFGESEDWQEIIMEISQDSYEGATNVSDDLSYNSGWYNHSVITFDYKGKRYYIEYKEHTSDNVSDTEYGDLVCLGSVEEMNDVITKEDLSRITIDYQNEIQILESKNKRLLEYKDTLDKLIPVSHRELVSFAKMMLTNHEERDLHTVEKSFGEFFLDYAKKRKHGVF